MAERNSESTVVKVIGVLAMIVIALSAATASLIDTPLADQWPWLGAVAVVFASLAKVAGEYIASRPAKHRAMAAAKPDSE